MDIMLKNVRLAFPTLWTPEPFPTGNDKTPYFSATFLLPKTHPQIKEIEAVMDALAKDKWGAKGPNTLKAAKAIGKVFFRDGEAKPDYDGFEGHYFVSARNKVRPTIIDGQRNPLSEADGKPYGGCYVNAKIGCYAYTKGNNGLGASILGIQFLRDGDAFGGARAADSDDFDEISAEESEADPLMG
jgi:hypothetical protein